MRVIQLTAGPENHGEERHPLVALPAAGSGQVTVSPIIPTLNEAKKPRARPAGFTGRDRRAVIVDGGSP